MRRAQDERTAIAFGMQDRGQRNADRGFSGAHFAIYEDSPLALIDEQFRGRMYDLCLGREQLALQACQNQLAVRTRRTAIDGWVGAIEGVQQFVAELGNEVLKAQGQLGRFLFEHVVVQGRRIYGRGRFDDLCVHGDAPKDGACITPHGAVTCPRVGRKSRLDSGSGRRGR